ncbi:MAG: 4-hydroxythreonine-4-phosphate dehydrogenase PdxA, partial [Candidatus Gastranaerophilales bacterium]|nr:4-hydroxythreonine-4-phosphate dehydrogenase PdxA [Candidatus Gastranaerophilales bacterium]
MTKTLITLGDPNGISPEITIKALNFLNLPEDKIALIANKNIINFYESKFKIPLKNRYEIIEIPYNKKDIQPGQETKEAGKFAYQALIKACKMALSDDIHSIVTAPLSKNAVKMAGHNYSGQTEILEQYLAHSNQKAEMLFVCNKFNVLLLTRHIAIKDVSEKIKKNIIISKTECLINFLKLKFKIRNPIVAICALNPHAGESGMFGKEEINEIIPAVKELQDKGINIQGPFPSDTLFFDCFSGKCKYDCYIAMYHDQGLIPVKLLERDNCVNTTIGLDILRTSPAHGTAFDIAGKNIANPSSMINAI